MNNLQTENYSWYALKLYSMKLQDILNYMKDKGLEYFVPMEYVFIERDGEVPLKVLRPVVRNLLFIKKDREEKDIKSIVQECPYKVSVVKRGVGDRRYYEIRSKEMLEFQRMCNPDIELKRYISEADAKIKKGTPVEIFAGTLKGLTGKLVRQNKKYFLLKEVPGMAVLVKVSKWCCRKI